MSTHKHIDRICVIAITLSLIATLLFMNGEALGIQPASKVMGYEAKLFDTSRVHTIEIIMDDWDSFIETCENEEYTACAVVIDNEAYKNVGLRAKGNTSLSTVSSMGSDRYSFKIEFDQYDSGKTYYGLDKLCLNNVIQDTTYMKDYLTYQLMGEFGVAAPLCSYVYVTVNGEDWGLYLAVEGVEEGFLQRNYGRSYGELYKPDSMSFGGGRGNGRDFDMSGFMNRDGGGEDGGQAGNMQIPAQRGAAPEDIAPPAPGGWDPNASGDGESGGPGGGFTLGGMGSDDVKLKYTDGDPDSYSNIFSSAKTDVSDVDQARLIQALKVLNEGNADGALNIDQVLRYFVVHNFVVNGDSYTGTMVHNYYLYEENGQLSMIPWDYNLAFGTFQGNDAFGAVNDPIDAPLSVSGGGDRPMVDWIFSKAEYTQLYHQYFQQFLDRADCAAIIEQAYILIAPYVERDSTKFCTYEEFEAGVSALKTFCRLRTESVSGQLAGTIPSTDEGQSTDDSSLVDASNLILSDMGTMGGEGGPGGDRFTQGKGWGSGGSSDMENGVQPNGDSVPALGSSGTGDRQPPENMELPDGVPGGGGDATPNGDFSGGVTAKLNVAALISVGISVVVLLAGLLIAFQFKRR